MMRWIDWHQFYESTWDDHHGEETLNLDRKNCIKAE